MLDVAAAEVLSRTLKVLLVDDDADVRRFFRDILEAAGMAVTPAATAKEGARLALDGAYDVAVIDECLPDRRGTALVRWLRRRRPALAVVMFSAYADWPMYFRAMGCGAKDVVTKMLPARELLRVVKGVVPPA